MTTATMLAIVVVITLSLAFQGRCMPHYQQAGGGLNTANWWDSFNKQGASKCKEHYLMKGLWRSACNHLYCLEGAHCAKNYNIYATGPVLKANWWDCLNKGHGGWCTCTDGSYLTGFYRTSGQRLHNLEEGYCRRVPHSTKWGTCYDQNVRIAFDKKGLSKCEKDGYFMVGLWKTRNCDGLYCIEAFKCCQPAAAPTKTKYYINLSFSNPGPDVYITWTQVGHSKHLDIPSHSTVGQVISIESATQPSAIQFRIYATATGKLLRSFDKTPTLQQGQAVLIRIDPALFKTKYYINLSVSNPGPSVYITWTQLGYTKKLYIASHSTFNKVISFESAAKPSAIQFRIYVIATGKLVRSFDVMPTLQPGEATVIGIVPAPTQKKYYINLRLHNPGSGVYIAWTQVGHSKHLNIPSHSTVARLISFESATQPSAIQFRIYAIGTETLVRIFEIMPTLQPGEATVIETIPATPQFKTYYITLAISNLGPGVVIKWNQNGQPTQSHIPAHSNFQQSISIKSATRPSIIQFQIYGAGTGRFVKSFDVLPTLQQGKATAINIGEVSTPKRHGYVISCSACQSNDLCKSAGYLYDGFQGYEGKIIVYSCICGPGFYLGADKRTCVANGTPDISSSQSRFLSDLYSSVVINCDFCNGKRCVQVGIASYPLYECRRQ